MLGATHPNLVREQGEKYRFCLERLAAELGITQARRLLQPLRRAPRADRVHRGGRPLRHPLPEPGADHLGHAGLRVRLRQGGRSPRPTGTPRSCWPRTAACSSRSATPTPLADACLDLLRDEPRRHAMRKRAYLMGREMIWSSVAHRYMESFQRARESRVGLVPALAGRSDPRRAPAEPPVAAVRPSVADDRFHRPAPARRSTAFPTSTRGTARTTTPGPWSSAPCWKNWGRRRRRSRRPPFTYAAFLHYAFDRRTRRFRNFLGYDRRWLEEAGSEDSLGRAIWAWGRASAASTTPGSAAWAAELFEEAIARLRRHHLASGVGLRAAGHSRVLPPAQRRPAGRPTPRRPDGAADRGSSTRTPADDWPWFEDVLTYDNAKLPHALILSGRWKGTAKGAGDRAAQSPLVGLHPEIPARPFPSHRLQRVLPARRDAGRLRSAADRGLLHGFRLHRGLSGDAGRIMAARGPLGLRLVHGPQRSGR